MIHIISDDWLSIVEINHVDSLILPTRVKIFRSGWFFIQRVCKKLLLIFRGTSDIVESLHSFTRIFNNFMFIVNNEVGGKSQRLLAMLSESMNQSQFTCDKLPLDYTLCFRSIFQPVYIFSPLLWMPQIDCHILIIM